MDSKDQALTFGQKAVLAIVDYLLIGGVIVLASFLYRSHMEKFHARQDYLRRSAEMKVQALADVWTLHYQAVALGNKLMFFTMNAPNNPQNDIDKMLLKIRPQREPLLAKMQDKTEQLLAALEGAHYFFGDYLYVRVREHVENYRRLMNAFLSGDQAEYTRLEAALRTTRIDSDTALAVIEEYIP